MACSYLPAGLNSWFTAFQPHTASLTSSFLPRGLCSGCFCCLNSPPPLPPSLHVANSCSIPQISVEVTFTGRPDLISKSSTSSSYYTSSYFFFQSFYYNWSSMLLCNYRLNVATLRRLQTSVGWACSALLTTVNPWIQS